MCCRIWLLKDQSTPIYISGAWPITRYQSNKINLLISFSSISVLSFPCFFSLLPSSRVWVDLSRFALENGPFSTKARNLCCFARKASGDRHVSTVSIVLLRGSISRANNEEE
jgi:hypothetical protein